MGSFNLDARETLNRAIRRKLTGPNGGELPHDLAAAVLEAAAELLGDEDECTVEELNTLFDLEWREPEWSWPLNDLDEAIGEAEGDLYREENLFDLLMSTVASDWSLLDSTPGGSATMMSDGGVGLYEFTVDDRVYFVVLAERDVCESVWWFAHVVDDVDSRADAIRKAAFGMSEDPFD